jgi:hypothetical protein
MVVTITDVIPEWLETDVRVLVAAVLAIGVVGLISEEGEGIVLRVDEVVTGAGAKATELDGATTVFEREAKVIVLAASTIVPGLEEEEVTVSANPLSVEVDLDAVVVGVGDEGGEMGAEAKILGGELEAVE